MVGCNSFMFILWEVFLMKKMFLASALMLCSGAAMAMEVSSDSIEHGRLKNEQACVKMGGQDISPALTITDLPGRANYLTIIMDDPDAQSVAGKTWVHWNVFNLPASNTQIAAGQALEAEILANSSGQNAYEGMCPPNGRHTYRIAVLSSYEKLDTAGLGEVTIEQAKERFNGKINAVTMVTGSWSGPDVPIGVKTHPEPRP